MFTGHVNAVCINEAFSYGTIRRMPDIHPSMQRLLQSAQLATAKSKAPITDFAGIGDALDVSAAVITNWKARGVSKQGAIKAAAEWHCTVDWILEGEGSPAAMVIDGQHRWFADLKDLDPQKVLLDALNIQSLDPRQLESAEAKTRRAEEEQLLAAFRVLPSSERRDLVRGLTVRAEALEEMISRYMQERAGAMPPAPASRDLPPSFGDRLGGDSQLGGLDEELPKKPKTKE